MLRTPPSTPLPVALCHIFFRHKGKMVFFFLVVAGLVAVAASLGPRSYRSQAKLFVRLGRENVTLDPTATLGQTPVVAVPPSRENEINSVIDMLKSRALLEQVVAKLGPGTILGRDELPPQAVPFAHARAAPRRRSADDLRLSPWSDDPPLPSDDRYLATARLAKMLEVEIVKKTNLIRVTCDGPSPEVSQAIVTTLIDFYLDQHVRLNRTPGAYQFLKEQTARLQAQLTSTEEELRKLKSTTGLSSPEAQRQAVVTRMGRLQDELLQAEGSIAASEATTRLLRDKLVGLPRTHVSAVTKGFPNMAADSMRGQLYTLQLKAKELSAKYPERHPEVRQVSEQLTAARALLAREETGREQVTTGPNRMYEEAQLALLREEPVLAALQARAASLRSQLARQRERLEQINRDQVRIARLQRQFELREGHYRKYADNLEQLQVDTALATEKLSNISVVQPATFDARTVRPRLLMTLGLGLLFALGGSLGLAVLCDRLSSSFRGPEEVQQALGLPVLASLPRLSPAQLPRNGEPSS